MDKTQNKHAFVRCPHFMCHMTDVGRIAMKFARPLLASYTHLSRNVVSEKETGRDIRHRHPSVCPSLAHIF